MKLRMVTSAVILILPSLMNQRTICTIFREAGRSQQRTANWEGGGLKPINFRSRYYNVNRFTTSVCVLGLNFLFVKYPTSNRIVQ